MDSKITKEWGYKVLSPVSVNFYHVLLPQIGISFLSRTLKEYKEIEYKEDKSVVITTENPMDLQLLLQNLEPALEKMETQFAQTDKFTYKVLPINKTFVKNWFLSLEGAIALIVISQCPGLKLKAYDFDLLNSQVGGIYLHPFTILFHENYAKVIHPIRVNNFFLREQVERTISTAMRGILQRAEQASEGLEGMAIVSYAEEKTKLPSGLIAKIVNEKSRAIKFPKHSPLFK